MNSSSDNESESSLPTHHKTAPKFPSSPPVLICASSSPIMDNDPVLKLEPPATRDLEAARTALKRVSSNETERPPSGQQSRGNADEEVYTTSEDEEDSDPADKIVEFDWADLHQRYHDAISKCGEQETALKEEWESLMTYFRIWAASGHQHETNRTYHRLQTRSTYVQNSEEKLEKTRNHYINVVRAFESALNLLKANGFGR